MEVDDKLIDRLSELAKLRFYKTEKEAVKNDLSNILNFMGKLNELNTDGVKPLIYLSNEIHTLREDVVINTISKEEALLNAPQKDSDYIKVPKVLKK